MAKVIRRGTIQLALALLLLALVAPVGAATDDPADGEILPPPAGSNFALKAYAEGVQIYRWTGTTWAFVKPQAVLYTGDDEDDEAIGIHYAGPTWESLSGSKVVGTVIDKYIPDPTAIPWFLLKAVSNEGPGVFRRVTYIQRLYTVGGVAPADPGEFVGEEAKVPYTAWYVFYR